MALSTLQTLHYDVEDVNRLQTKVAKAILPIVQVPFLDGVLVEGIDLTGTDVTHVEHGLGRAVQGWFVVDISDYALIARADQSNLPDSILPLRASSAATISVWVF